MHIPVIGGRENLGARTWATEIRQATSEIFLISPHFGRAFDAIKWLTLRHANTSTMLMRRSVLLAVLARAVHGRTKPALAEGVLEYAAGALGGMIDTARQQAIADGVRAIPPAVYRSLLGYFPAALLQKCRYAVGSHGPLTLPALAFSYGDAMAITLGDVILFKKERVAQSDLKVWAHELTHVMQYQRWGVRGFADRYVRDTQAVEQEAIENADRFLEWLGHRGRMASAQYRPAGFFAGNAPPGESQRSTNKSRIATFR
jgi:hypothetical protein